MKMYSIIIRDDTNTMIAAYHTANISLEDAEMSARCFWMDYAAKAGRGIPHRYNVGEQIA